MSKVHSYPWYPADWRGSEARMTMTLEERCIYRELLDHHYEQGSLPNDPRALRIIAGCDKEEFERAWPRVSKQFYEQDDRLYQARVLEKLIELGELSDKRKAIAQKAAKARHKHAQSTASSNAPSSALSTAKEMLGECSPPTPTITPTITPLKSRFSVVPKNESNTSEEDLVLAIAIGLRKRHPNPQKMTEDQIVQQLISILKPTETLLELATTVDGNHTALCRLDASMGGWKGKEAQYIPTLRKWLSTSARDPTEAAPAIRYEDLKAQEWMA